MSYWVTAFLGLGTNLPGKDGTLEENLRQACWELGEHDVIRIAALSSTYRSRPWGIEDQPDFLNAVARIETLLSAADLLEIAKEIEQHMGRRETHRWGPRLIDIDILLYGMETIRSSLLTVPHVHLLERAFAVVPLLEIEPGARLPDGTEIRTLIDLDQLKEEVVKQPGLGGSSN
jgi:2-amino-4-hydroxy-6-hydroxymethyldihydropteridine diphosphokinase